jgi:YidC/Oxa1 family membrane protein insertase
MNLLCSATNAGNAQAKLGDRRVVDGETTTVEYPVDCGNGVATRIPYYLFAVLMFGTTYFQQRQMQKASPPGAASQQQQALLKIMPLMFGVFGIFFPAGLVVYWTTSNAWQIGQQYFMLKNRPTAETLAARANERPKAERKGFMSSMMQRAEQERKRREGGTPKPKPQAGGRSTDGSKRTPPKPKPGGAGGGGGASGTGRKKRPKR